MTTIIAACTSGVVCDRDAAITLLALSTGLRACDIIELRLGDIDWRGQTLGLVQQKTGNPLTVPLIDVLTSTLADYVLHERPETDDDHVFVRRVAPHVRLGDHAAIHRVTATVFTAAGVTDAKGGTRLLRHKRRLSDAAGRDAVADHRRGARSCQRGIDQAVHEH